MFIQTKWSNRHWNKNAGVNNFRSHHSTKKTVGIIKINTPSKQKYSTQGRLHYCLKNSEVNHVRKPIPGTQDNKGCVSEGTADKGTDQVITHTNWGVYVHTDHSVQWIMVQTIKSLPTGILTDGMIWHLHKTLKYRRIRKYLIEFVFTIQFSSVFFWVVWINVISSEISVIWLQ